MCHIHYQLGVKHKDLNEDHSCNDHLQDKTAVAISHLHN